jgi:hypothetical protein
MELPGIAPFNSGHPFTVRTVAKKNSFHFKQGAFQKLVTPGKNRID